MKPTAEQLAAAVLELGAIPYFPVESGSQLAVIKQLERFVSNAHELRWLVDSAVEIMREWKGVPELRGLYCTRFKPADGKENDCTLPGYTPADSETRYAIEEAKRAHLPPPVEVLALAKRKEIGGAR